MTNALKKEDMESNDKFIITQLPKHGYMTELAQLCNCNRKTVRRALFQGHDGPKSRLVRETFKKLYSTPLANEQVAGKAVE